MTHKEILIKLIKIAEKQQQAIDKLSKQIYKKADQPEAENPNFIVFLKKAWPIAVLNAGATAGETPEVSYNPGEIRQMPDGSQVVLGSGYVLTVRNFPKDAKIQQATINNLKNNIKARSEFAHLSDSVNVIFG